MEGDAAVIGKTSGKDAANDKPTYPAILGIAASQALLQDLTNRMRDSIAGLPMTHDELDRLARFAAERAH